MVALNGVTKWVVYRGGIPRTLTREVLSSISPRTCYIVKTHSFFYCSSKRGKHVENGLIEAWYTDLECYH